MYELKSTIIRVIATENIDPGVVEEGIFVQQKDFTDGSIHIKYDGKAYELFKGEFEKLDQEEVVDIMLKKLDRMGENILGLGR